mmetsp:Transcript_70012/g.202906  ORF Transcript_70012/g.202906 Transcript_70012/m.202906 type:complete len:227 (+) Transcript_70012:406-1086(+)
MQDGAALHSEITRVQVGPMSPKDLEALARLPVKEAYGSHERAPAMGLPIEDAVGEAFQPTFQLLHRTADEPERRGVALHGPGGRVGARIQQGGGGVKGAGGGTEREVERGHAGVYGEQGDPGRPRVQGFDALLHQDLSHKGRVPRQRGPVQQGGAHGLPAAAIPGTRAPGPRRGPAQNRAEGLQVERGRLGAGHERQALQVLVRGTQDEARPVGVSGVEGVLRADF